MSLQIRQLRLVQRLHLPENGFLVVAIQRIKGVKQLYHLQILIVGTAFDIDLEMSLLRLLHRLHQLEKRIREWC